MTMNATGGLAGGNMSLGKATLAAGTTTTHSTTGTLTYQIAGQIYQRTALTNAATPTVDYNTGRAFVPLRADEACIFVFGFDAAGNTRVMQGPVVKLSDVVGKLSAVHFPIVPDDVAPAGYLYAQAGSTLVGTWTMGVNNLSGVTGMTYTFRDLSVAPAVPITA